MTWAKLDDQFPTHPKVMRAGPEAAWLFVAGLCYCARHLTDGLLPKCAVVTLVSVRNVQRLVAKLVDVGLWEDVGDDYLVHDYLEYNPSRADVEGVRDSANVRMNAARSSEERSREQTEEGSSEVHPSRPRPLLTRAFDDDFAALWDVYPRHKARADALKAYSARRNQGVTHDDLALAVKHYAAECDSEARDQQFVMYGATFFGPRERWRDYLEPPILPATIEELATPTRIVGRLPWVCTAGNSECVDGWIDTPSGAKSCECRS